MNHPSRSSRQFQIELKIAATREAVWNALTSDTELRRWFANEAEVTPGVGGRILWNWPAIHAWEQTIDLWEPLSCLKTRYRSSVQGADGSLIPLFMEFTLSGDGGTTTLRLVHSGFGNESSFDQEFDGIRRGWPVELQSLRIYLEHHRGRDRQLASGICELGTSLDDGFSRLTGPLGLGCAETIANLRPGDPFRFTTPDGDTFSGRTLARFGREFAAEVDSHGHAFLRICTESCGPGPIAWVWLATYDRPAFDVRTQKERFDRMLDRCFGKESGKTGQPRSL